MDPLAGVKAWKDTSYFLMLACAKRGHEVCYLDQRDLWLEHDDLYATVQWLQVNEDVESPFTVKREESVAMADMDAIWILSLIHI